MERFTQGLRSLAQESSRNASTSFSGPDFSSDHAQVVVRRANRAFIIQALTFPSLALTMLGMHLGGPHKNGSHIERQVVSLWTCSKLCAISFAVGLFVGFTLKRRCKRWVTKLLKRLKDD